MVKKFFYPFLLTFLCWGCQDKIPELNLSEEKADTRAAYDNGYVEWDNVDHLFYKLDGDVLHELSIPWEPGCSSALGVPSEWVDQELRNPDPYQRAYSKENGWRLVYSNLLQKGERNKFFALYNRNTGLFRLFFYSVEASSGNGTTSTTIGLGITGSSSLLNFAFDDALAMDCRQMNPTTFYAPSCLIKKEGGKVTGAGYKGNTWYAIEVELAYDDSALNSNNLQARLWGTNWSSISTNGTMAGDITGSIQTTYSNNPGLNFNLSSITNNSSTKGDTIVNIQASGDVIGNSLGEKIEVEKQKNTPFFKNLWNNMVSSFPDLAAKGAKEGLNALITSGTSSALKAVGKLTKGLLGRSSSPMSSTSKVDLGLDLKLNETSTSISDVAGWGSILPCPLPGSCYPNALFNERMGVWNIAATPKVYTDMYIYAYYYPHDQVPNQTEPRCFQYEFRYSLSPQTLCINPDVSQDFTVTNLEEEMVFDSGLRYVLTDKVIYGLYKENPLYTSVDNYIGVSDEKPYKPDFIGMGTIPSDEAYEKFWSSGTYNDRYILYHISFELVSKTENQKYFFSKYFPVQCVKRNSYYAEKEISIPMMNAMTIAEEECE